uniref:Uncharacterized protein n=1 Tax=viral metagenome TaxID=1070528 RepID=A0A6C0AM59_9ZZZZ
MTILIIIISFLKLLISNNIFFILFKRPLYTHFH